MRHWTMAVAPLAIALAACGADGKKEQHDRGAAEAGPATAKSYALSGFTGVAVTGPDDVTIRRGDAFSIKAEGPQREIEALEIKLDGEMLSVGRKSAGLDFGRDSEGVRIAITMPKLGMARLTGSGSIDADIIDGDAVEARVTGSGDLKVGKLTAKTLKLAVSGSGDMEIADGAVDSGDFGVTGSGNIEAEKLVAQTLTVSITGSGDVEAQAKGSAAIKILGSGDATIGGGGKCSTQALGSGTATCR